MRAIAFTRGGAAIATAGDDTRVREWDRDGNLLAEWPGVAFGAEGSSVAIALSADGSLVAASVPVEGDVRLGLWDASVAAPRAWLEPPSAVHALALSADARWLAAGGDHADLTLWDLRSGRRSILQHADTADRVHSLAFSPDGKTLYAGGRFFGLRAWDLETRRSHGLVPGGLAVDDVAPSPDGRRLALLRGHWRLDPMVVDAATGRPLWSHVPD